MFTGLVEAVGMFEGLTKAMGRPPRLSVQVPRELGPLRVGDSVAVNGVCQTVIEIGRSTISMDVLEETLARTNLGDLHAGARVNLERAATPTTHMGGHLVTGHVDDTGVVLGRSRAGPDWVYEIGVNRKYMAFIAPKGSIAVDGVSLTVVETQAASFEVHVIPRTFEHTTLRDRAVGSRVNIEIDLIARYIANFIERSGPERVEGEGTGADSAKLTKDFLAEHGFA